MYTYLLGGYIVWAWDGVALGRLIKEARERRKWSQRQLAKKAGVSHSYVSHLEQGMYDRPRRELVLKVTHSLELEEWEIEHYSEWVRPELYPHVKHIAEDRADYVVEGDPQDPQLEEIQVNLKTIKKLNPQRLDELANTILAVKEKTEREAR